MAGSAHNTVRNRRQGRGGNSPGGSSPAKASLAAAAAGKGAGAGVLEVTKFIGLDSGAVAGDPDAPEVLSAVSPAQTVKPGGAAGFGHAAAAVAVAVAESAADTALSDDDVEDFDEEDEFDDEGEDGYYSTED